MNCDLCRHARSFHIIGRSTGKRVNVCTNVCVNIGRSCMDILKNLSFLFPVSGSSVLVRKFVVYPFGNLAIHPYVGYNRSHLIWVGSCNEVTLTVLESSLLCGLAALIRDVGRGLLLFIFVVNSSHFPQRRLPKVRPIIGPFCGCQHTLLRQNLYSI